MPGVTGANLKRRIELIMTNHVAAQLNRGRKLLLAAAGAVVLAIPLAIGLIHGSVAPVSAAPLTPFEVASVKPSTEPAKDMGFCIGTCSFGERFSVAGSRVTIQFMSLDHLILAAWGIKAHQLAGPDWMKSQRFDILAKIPDGASKDQVPEMLQALLSESFHLAIHRDRRDQSVFALVVGANGLKLPKAAADTDAAAAPAGARPIYSPDGEALQMAGESGVIITKGTYGSMRGGRGSDGRMQWVFSKLSMPALAALVTPHVDRPVVDQTNLPGNYRLVFQNQRIAAGTRRIR